MTECKDAYDWSAHIQGASHFYGFGGLKNVKYVRPQPVFLPPGHMASIIRVLDSASMATEREADIRETETGEVECRNKYHPGRLYSELCADLLSVRRP